MYFHQIQNMLSQQMRSRNYDLEAGDGQLSLFPSNSVANYNNQYRSHERLAVAPSLITDTTLFSTDVPTELVVANNVDLDTTLFSTDVPTELIWLSLIILVLVVSLNL